MTSFSEYAARPRSRRGRRSSAIALLVAAGVLVPAGAASADHMPGMNGTMCPHASGEGPDSLAAAGPDEPAPSERAPSSAPLAPAVKPTSTAPAPEPAAPKPVAQVQKPVTQVGKPATQVQTGRPATATPAARSAPATARTTVRAVATTTVAEPAHAARPKAERPARRADTARRSFAHRFNGLEPRAAGPYAVELEAVAGPVARAATPDRPSPFPVGLLVGVLAVAAAIGGLFVLWRRGRGGTVVNERTGVPLEPASAGAAIEAELHEMISEARARQLLAPSPEDESAESEQSVGTH